MKVGLVVHAAHRLILPFAKTEKTKESLQWPKHAILEVAGVLKKGDAGQVMIPYL